MGQTDPIMEGPTKTVSFVNFKQFRTQVIAESPWHSDNTIIGCWCKVMQDDTVFKEIRKPGMEEPVSSGAIILPILGGLGEPWPDAQPPSPAPPSPLFDIAMFNPVIEVDDSQETETVTGATEGNTASTAAASVATSSSSTRPSDAPTLPTLDETQPPVAQRALLAGLLGMAWSYKPP